MCKAHVLRFSCGHGLLMSLEVCSCSPCPTIKITSNKLQQQPYRCWNCQCKRTPSASTPNTSREASCASSFSSLDSTSSSSNSTSSRPAPTKKFSTFSCNNSRPSYPTPGLLCSPSKPFSFTCSYLHAPAPHYTALSPHLPHQNHDCPPCQLEAARTLSGLDITKDVKATWPKVRAQRSSCTDGRYSVHDWDGPEAYARYLDEQKREDRAMWFFLGKKWVQDLRAARVLMGEEDGLGLLG